MEQQLAELHRIFRTTKEATGEFVDMLTPVIQNAQSDYVRLLHQHISIEEKRRLTRLDGLLELIEKIQQPGSIYSPANGLFNRFLQELNLEQFGLHNFVEHLDLVILEFLDEERQEALIQMREVGHADYLTVKAVLVNLNKRFDEENVTLKSSESQNKRFSVGNLLKKSHSKESV